MGESNMIPALVAAKGRRIARDLKVDHRLDRLERFMKGVIAALALIGSIVLGAVVERLIQLLAGS